MLTTTAWLSHSLVIGRTAIHNKALYKCLIHSFIHSFRRAVERATVEHGASNIKAMGSIRMNELIKLCLESNVSRFG